MYKTAISSEDLSGPQCLNSTEVEKPCHEGGGKRNEIMMKGHGMKYWWESLLAILNEVLGSTDFGNFYFSLAL